MASPRVIWLKSRDSRQVNEDGAASEAITPGMLVQGVSTISKQSNAGTDCARTFALEREEMGKGIDDAYAVGDQVKVGTFAPGDRVYALIASGQNITAGQYLEAAADGTLRAIASGTRIARSLDTTGAVTVLTRLRAEVMAIFLAVAGLALAYLTKHVAGIDLMAALPHFGGSHFDHMNTLFLLGGVSMAPAAADDGRDFMRGAGRWATEQFIKAMQPGGKGITVAALRNNSTLRRDEWIEFDNAIITEGRARLRGVQDLINAGLTKRIKNGLAKTLLSWQKVSDMTDAIVSMTGVVRSDNARPDWLSDYLPLPITHKDFDIDLRQLEASRLGGEGLDTTSAGVAGRKCAEKSEDMLFNGYPNKFGGYAIYGYTNAPNRNTTGFGAAGAWTGAKTGAEALADVQTMIGIANADFFYGPFVLYVDAAADLWLTNDFKANGQNSIRTRILDLPQIQDIRVSDKLTAELVLVQLSRDVVEWVIGENLQTVQWDLSGGFEVAFKSFQIAVPLIRSDYSDRSGIVHMS